MRVIWKFFCSRKLALVLIAVIVVVSIIGTVIPQKASPNVYIERFGEGWFRFFRATGIINLYHSWWFNLLFVLISINIIVCSIDRLRKILHFLRKRTVVVEEKTISGMRNFESFESVSDIEEIRRIFKKNNYRIRTQDSGKLRYMMAEKGIISRFGSTITHFSILIIFLGVAIGLWKGFKTSINISEGETINVPTADFQLRLDKFLVEYYGNTGKPKDYKSTLTVIDNGKEILTKTIEVNHPLKYKGMVFYQSSYGQSGDVGSMDINLLTRESPPTLLNSYRVSVGDSFHILDTNYEIRVADFFPDFVMDAMGKPANRSRRLENPAVLLKVFKDGEFLFNIWSFMKYGVPHLPEDFKYTPRLTNVHSRMYSGLQITHDPGVPVVWLGCLLIVVGLFVSFYTSHKRIWLISIPKENKVAVKIGGTANKNLIGFGSEFSRLISQIKGRK